MFKPEGFSLEIFKQRYAFTPKESWDDACVRLARQMGLAESPDKQKIYEEKFNYILQENLFVPGGRIWYGAGRTNPNMLNCFVLLSDLDSKEGWGRVAYEMIITSMSGGGCGIDFSDVRPRGSSISSHRGECPGPLELMKLLDGCAKPVKAGGGRRVALMFSLDLDHPDIEEFLNAKLIKGELTHANISVRSKRTTDFIKAVESDGEWELSWKGKYKKIIKAKSLWNLIVSNAYNSAEPGFLNWELIEKESNTQYFAPVITTNPCGEQPLNKHGACDLGHLVLPRFVKDNEIDFELLRDTIRSSVRFLDNVLTVNHYPLPEMQKSSLNSRRIGLGTTGLADAMLLLGHKYGSDSGNQFIDKLYRFISKNAYEASIMLSIEKGAFSLCDREKHVQSGFIKRLPVKIRSLILEHGIRNSTVLTAAPTGTVSILSGNCSSGIEPIFSPAYERRYWDKDERKTELVFHPLFEKFMQEKKDISHFVGSHDLSVRDHLEVQKIVQRHIDSACSKTINIPEKYPIKEVEKLWMEYLPHIKGATFYRENSRGFVKTDGTVEEPPLKPISLNDAKKKFKTEHLVENLNGLECPTGVCAL